MNMNSPAAVRRERRRVATEDHSGTVNGLIGIDLLDLQLLLDELPLEFDRVLDDERRVKTLAAALEIQPTLLRSELRNHGLPPSVANALAVLKPWMRRMDSDSPSLVQWKTSVTPVARSAMRTGDSVGVRGEDGQFRFTCASCGCVAAVLLVDDSGRDLDAGPVLGGECLTWLGEDEPSVRLEFIAVLTGAAPRPLVELCRGADVLDPTQLHSIDPELAAFLCRIRQRVYCCDCWATWVEFDDGFYDCTRGRCPQGHIQTLDD